MLRSLARIPSAVRAPAVLLRGGRLAPSLHLRRIAIASGSAVATRRAVPIFNDRPHPTNEERYIAGTQYAPHGLRRESTKMEEVFGALCFSARAQREYLPPDVFREVDHRVNTHQPIPAELTERFAAGLHRWAVERGATHYTHWFTPMTGRSASKHDTFMQRSGDHVISTFSGKTLARGEPDASSFPHGGLRATHQARGYTVWDPSSPCFIIHHGTGATLMIPSVFISWKGRALDEKTPLLRANEALNREGLRMLRAAGEDRHTYVRTDSGIEQEFFLVDKDYVLRRPDILQTGRSLLGAAPPRGQELADQYFSDLSERTMRLINEAEVELWRLGILQTTRHKEVAPGQYEIAPVFSPTSVASDQNILVQEVLSRVAHHHGMEAIFHEKPFAGLNGSGKHNNWSVGTDRVPSVFEPGDMPQENMIFMLFLAALLRGFDLHADLLRVATASASNDLRLGANEAPPAILSVYMGEDVSDAVEKFLNNDPSPSKYRKTYDDLGFSCLPEFRRHSTDRNRTSPFAFTGNKFEFRAIGANQPAHRNNYFLNTIMADSCRALAEAIEKRVGANDSSEKRREVAKDVAREFIRAHKRVIFDGDCYSDEWRKEAERRGLVNRKTTPEAIQRLTDKKNVTLFADLRVLSEEGVFARANIWNSEYALKVLTEALSLVSLVNTRVLPACYDIQGSMASAIDGSNSVGIKALEAQTARLAKITSLIGQLTASINQVEQLTHELEHISKDAAERSLFCANKLLPAMDAVRKAADQLEGLCDATVWPLPSYHEMLFTGQVYDVHAVDV